MCWNKHSKDDDRDYMPQSWGQVSNNWHAIHRVRRFGQVVVGLPGSTRGIYPHRFRYAKVLMEKAKISLSTPRAVFY